MTKIACSLPSPSAPRPQAAPASAALDHFLFAGDPGAPARQRAPSAIWLSACDGITLSARGRRAAEQAYAELSRPVGLPLPHWFAALRNRLAALFDAPDGEVVLARSEGEAEAIFSALASAALAGPLVHIAAATPERSGEMTEDARFYSLRDRYGLPRDLAEIDVEVARLSEQALAQGCAIALHVADCSESGLAGPNRATAADIAAAHPGRALVLVDARQLPASRRRIAADLAAGFAVLLSGATFAGAPRGTAALLLPGALAGRIESFDLPEQAASSAALSWPPSLRDKRDGDFAALADLGLGLRWECALAELESFFALPADMRAEAASAIAHEIRRHLSAAPALKEVDRGWQRDARPLYPILTFDERGRPLKTERLRRALADPAARSGWIARGRPVHLGSALRIGERKALRLAPGAATFNDLAERIDEGRGFAAAFQPLAEDLLETFSLWSELASTLSS